MDEHEIQISKFGKLLVFFSEIHDFPPHPQQLKNAKVTP